MLESQEVDICECGAYLVLNASVYIPISMQNHVAHH
jgi:hypothetical protein